MLYKKKQIETKNNVEAGKIVKIPNAATAPASDPTVPGALGLRPAPKNVKNNLCIIFLETKFKSLSAHFYSPIFSAILANLACKFQNSDVKFAPNSDMFKFASTSR